ncbi:unnamed protein product, partial [Musa textilis]
GHFRQVVGGRLSRTTCSSGFRYRWRQKRASVAVALFCSMWGFPSPSGFCRKGSTKSSSRRWKETVSPKLASYPLS